MTTNKPEDTIKDRSFAHGPIILVIETIKKPEDAVKDGHLANGPITLVIGSPRMETAHE